VLAAHPALADAMSTGRLSYSHARAIARVAELGDQRLVQELTVLAEHGTVAQLEDTVRGLCTVDKIEHPSADGGREALSHRWRDDSLWGMSAKLDPEHGALVQSAIDAVARQEGLTQAQALTRIAEIALATLNHGVEPAPTLRGDERAAIVIHLTAEAPPEPAAECSAEHSPSTTPTRPAGRIAGGPGLPTDVIQRLACAARIRPILFDARRDPREPVQPLDIGASRRLVSDKQYRALLIRHRGACAYPGCGNRIALEAHHVVHWLYGGKTIMSNLVLLCPRHHHAHHEGEYSISALGRGRFRFTLPELRELPHRIDPWTVANTIPIEDEHPNIAPDAATTHWDGSRLDRDYAVATLAQFLVDKRSA
jgi:5-methylcytosine-specific restriction endonuclease McrA